MSFQKFPWYQFEPLYGVFCTQGVRWWGQIFRHVTPSRDFAKVWVIITTPMIPLSHKSVSILHFELENSKDIIINFITRHVQAPLVVILELNPPVSFLIGCFHFSNWKFLVLFWIYFPELYPSYFRNFYFFNFKISRFETKKGREIFLNSDRADFVFCSSDAQKQAKPSPDGEIV